MNSFDLIKIKNFLVFLGRYIARAKTPVDLRLESYHRPPTMKPNLKSEVATDFLFHCDSLKLLVKKACTKLNDKVWVLLLSRQSDKESSLEALRGNLWNAFCREGKGRTR